MSESESVASAKRRPSFSLRPLHSILKKQGRMETQSEDSSVYAASANDIDFFIGDEMINCDRLI